MCLVVFWTLNMPHNNWHYSIFVLIKRNNVDFAWMLYAYFLFAVFSVTLQIVLYLWVVQFLWQSVKSKENQISFFPIRYVGRKYWFFFCALATSCLLFNKMEHSQCTAFNFQSIKIFKCTQSCLVDKLSLLIVETYEKCVAGLRAGIGD